jgi:hypothetical protein
MKALSLALITLGVLSASNRATLTFAGVWTLDANESSRGSDGGLRIMVMKVTPSQSGFNVIEVTKSETGPDLAQRRCVLDSDQGVIGPRARHPRGTIQVRCTGSPVNLTTIEHWTLSKNGAELVIKTTGGISLQLFFRRSTEARFPTR